jgi:hypothetical protein
MYHQLVEILATTTTQLAAVATTMPSVVVLALSPPMNFSFQAPLWQQGWRIEPQAHCQAR